MAEAGGTDLTSFPSESQAFRPPSSHSIQPGLVSFQASRSARNATYTLSGFPTTQSITHDIFWDPYFGRRIRLDAPPTSVQGESIVGNDWHSRASASSTCPRIEAAKRLKAYKVDLEWSGIASPPTLPATELLCGPRGQRIMTSMSSILNDFLEAFPERKKRNVPGNDKLPGPTSDDLAFELGSSPETTVNNVLHANIGYLVNDILQLCREATRWKRDCLAEHQQPQQQDEDYDWPVPLDEPLVLLQGSKASRGSPNHHADLQAAVPDFVAWCGNIEIGCCESKPRAVPASVGKLVTPRIDPITSIMDSILQRDRRRQPFELSSTSRTTASSPNTWQDKMLLQMTSQLFLRNVRSGLLLGDHGQILLPYELLPAPAIESSSCPTQRRAFYLSFADAAVQTNVPFLDFDPASDEDPRVQATRATQIASDATGTSSTQSLQFDCRPGVVWGIVIWILSAWDRHKRNLRPRELPLNEQVADIAVEPTEANIPEHRQGPLHSHNLSLTAGERGIRDNTADNVYSRHQPLQQRLLVCPLPWNFGAYANIYRGVVDHRHESSSFGDAPILVPFKRLRSQAIIIKAQRPPLIADSDDVMDGPAPPVLMEPPQEHVLESIKARASGEHRALHTLAALQGTVIPRLLGTMSPESTPQSHSIKLVMEDAGQPLSALFAPHYRAILQVWGPTIADELKIAIKQAHALGVAHGDISPSNVLIRWINADQICLELDGVRAMAENVLQDANLTLSSTPPSHGSANALERSATEHDSPKRHADVGSESEATMISGSTSFSSIGSKNSGHEDGSLSLTFAPSTPARLRVMLIDWAEAVFSPGPAFESCQEQDLRALKTILRGAEGRK